MRACIIILAAGEGKRMKSDLPKVLHRLGGKTFIDRVVSVVEETPFAPPVVVVSSAHTLVQEEIGGRAYYAVQDSPRGTGHAVLSAKNNVPPDADCVVVLYGDHPRMSSASILSLLNEQKKTGAIMVVAYCAVPNFDGAYAPFKSFGRIVRDENGRIVKNVQVRDATESELSLREVDPGMYCFSAPWLWSHLPLLDTQNAQGEMYLTDLLSLALSEGGEISSVEIPPKEALGINTKEDLLAAENTPL